MRQELVFDIFKALSGMHMSQQGCGVWGVGTTTFKTEIRIKLVQAHNQSCKPTWLYDCRYLDRHHLVVALLPTFSTT
jgi:tartrate dehydratase alpha subunit/fumarate hydratase class I-like protein